MKKKNVSFLLIFFIFCVGELLNTHIGEREGRVKPKRRFSLRESSHKTTRT